MPTVPMTRVALPGASRAGISGTFYPSGLYKNGRSSTQFHAGKKSPNGHLGLLDQKSSWSPSSPSSPSRLLGPETVLEMLRHTVRILVPLPLSLSCGSSCMDVRFARTRVLTAKVLQFQSCSGKTGGTVFAATQPACLPGARVFLSLSSEVLNGPCFKVDIMVFLE